MNNQLHGIRTRRTLVYEDGNIAEPMRLLKFALLGAIILGGIGFVAGFVGPIIFTPEANQGPLLGIFITGPLGFIFGAVLGAVVALFRSPKPPKIEQ